MWYFFAYVAVFLAEALTCWLFFEKVFQRKAGKIRCALSFIIGYLLLLCIVFWENALLNTLAFAVVNGGILFLCYRGSTGKMLLSAAFLSFFMLASEFLVMLLLNIFVRDFQAYLYRLPVWCSLTVLSKLLFFFVVMMISRFLPKKEQREKSAPGETILLCVLPLTSIVVVVTLFSIGVTIRSAPLLEILMLVCMMLLLISNLLVIVIYRHVHKLANERAQLQIALERDAAQAEYYALIKDQYEQQRELIHDIRHHIQTLKCLSEKDSESALLRYAKQMEEDPALARRITYCSEPVINVILVRYAEMCCKKGIRFHCDVRDGCLKMLAVKDASIIFQNVLSNAMEAAELSQEKYVELSVYYRDEQAADCIVVINSCDIAPIERRDGLLKTTKEDFEHHGIGLRSVRRAVKRYQGALTFHYEDASRKFYLTITLPN